MNPRSRFAVILLILCLLLCPALILADASAKGSGTSAEVRYPNSTAHSTASSSGILTSNSTSDWKVDSTSNSTANLSLNPAASSPRVWIDYSGPTNGKSADLLLQSICRDNGTDLRNQIHNIGVIGFQSLDNWTLFAEALGKIDHIDEFHWRAAGPPPDHLLSALEQHHPGYRLFVTCYDRIRDPWASKNLFNIHDLLGLDQTPDPPRPGVVHRVHEYKAITGRTNLYSIKAHVEYGGEQYPEFLDVIQQIVQGTSSLRELDLGFSHGGCVVTDGQPRAFDFSQNPKFANTPFPALQHLKLSSYGFTDRVDGADTFPIPADAIERLQSPWNKLPMWILERIPPSLFWNLGVIGSFNDASTAPPRSPNLDAWLQRMDWGNIETLELDSVVPHILEKLNPILTSLKSISIGSGEADLIEPIYHVLNDTTRALNSISLSNIVWDSYDPLLDLITTQHGQSLKTLRLWEHQEARRKYCYKNLDHPQCNGNSYGQIYDDHLFLNITQLERLITVAPNITKLDLDLDRTLDKPLLNDTLTKLALLPALNDLTLRFESPDMTTRRQSNTSDYDSYRYPYHQANRDIFDPLINLTFAHNTFRHLRALQNQHLQANQTNTKFSPSLTSMTIIIGDLSSQHWSGMIPPDNFLLGKWDCHVVEPNGTNIQSTAGVGSGDGEILPEEICSGMMTYPSYYGSVGYTATTSNGQDAVITNMSPLTDEEEDAMLYEEIWDRS